MQTISSSLMKIVLVYFPQYVHLLLPCLPIWMTPPSLKEDSCLVWRRMYSFATDGTCIAFWESQFRYTSNVSTALVPFYVCLQSPSQYMSYFISK